MLKELVTWLSGKTGWSIGTTNTLHYGSWPQDGPSDAVQLKFSGGRTQFDDPKIFARTVQMLVRGATYESAEDLAFEAHEYLHAMKGETLNGVVTGEEWYINTSDSLQDPTDIGRDEKRRFIFSCNYILRGEKRF